MHSCAGSRRAMPLRRLQDNSSGVSGGLVDHKCLPGNECTVMTGQLLQLSCH